MLSLSPPHRYSSSQTVHAIRSASGYLELRMVQEAQRELDALSYRDQADPLALRFRVRIHLYQQHWEVAEPMARDAAALYPEDHEFLVQRIFALYQLDRPKDARRVLRRSPRWLHNTGLLHYNLACYEALIGDRATARECAKAAFTLNPDLKRRALRDPDLQAVLAEPLPGARAKRPGITTAADTRRTDGP